MGGEVVTGLLPVQKIWVQIRSDASRPVTKQQNGTALAVVHAP